MAIRCEVCGQYPIKGALRTFFQWPADVNQRVYWRTCLGIQELNIDKPDLYICSDHFEQMQTIRKGTALRKDAFPKRYEGPLPTFPQEDEIPKEELDPPQVKNEEIGIFEEPGPSAPIFDDEEIMPEELSMAKLMHLFAAAAKERPSSIVPLVTPITAETKAFSNILIDRQEKYLNAYCKSCLRQVDVVNMLEANCEGVSVPIMYKTVFMTEIEPSEIPQLMCRACIGLLFQCYKFASMTVKSSEVLRAARERFKYLPAIDDDTIDLKNIPQKYSARSSHKDIAEDEDDKEAVKITSKTVKKRKSPVKSKEAPPEKKGRRTSTRRASVKAKKVSKKILQDSDDEDESNDDNSDNDDADPDFDSVGYEVKDESPDPSDEEDEKEEKEEEQDDNYCMLCRHQFTNMARHMEKVHRVDWESKSCERKREDLPGKEQVETKEKIVKQKFRRSGKSLYTCRKCNMSSKYFKKMFEHLQSDHKDDLDCIFCGEEWDHEIQLLDHISDHAQKSVYCRIHFKAFDSYHQWRAHVSEPTHQVQCGICDKIFKTRSGRDNHRATHLKPETEIKCPLCPLVYGSRTNLRRHVRTFHEKKVFLCADCGIPFSTNHTLKVHTAKKHNKGQVRSGPIQCEYCGKIFKLAHSLRLHRAKRHLDQAQKCHICGKCFESEEKLKEHAQAFNHLLYQCDICSSTFKIKAHYLKHLMKLHAMNITEAAYLSMERKEFKMTKISKRNSKPESVKKRRGWEEGRLRGTDRPDVKVIDGKRHYICLVCDKVFLNDSNLSRHKDLHSDVKKHKCPHCNKTFSQKQGLHKHMPVHSDERPFECKICGKRYKDSCTLYKHRRIHGKSSLVGIHSVNLSPRRKKNNQAKFRHSSENTNELDGNSEGYDNSTYYNISPV